MTIPRAKRGLNVMWAKHNLCGNQRNELRLLFCYRNRNTSISILFVNTLLPIISWWKCCLMQLNGIIDNVKGLQTRFNLVINNATEFCCKKIKAICFEAWSKIGPTKNISKTTSTHQNAILFPENGNFRKKNSSICPNDSSKYIRVTTRQKTPRTQPSAETQIFSRPSESSCSSRKPFASDGTNFQQGVS